MDVKERSETPKLHRGVRQGLGLSPGYGAVQFADAAQGVLHLAADFHPRYDMRLLGPCPAQGFVLDQEGFKLAFKIDQSGAWFLQRGGDAFTHGPRYCWCGSKLSNARVLVWSWRHDNMPPYPDACLLPLP